MNVWPVCPPQTLKIPSRTNELPEVENDNDILQTIEIPDANVVLMLTAARVLVYNFKPLALVACHERSSDSIKDFGLNKMMSSASVLFNESKGLMFEENDSSLPYFKRKLVFYISTEKNYLLNYQLLKNTTDATLFQEYGLPIVDLTWKSVNLEHDYDEAIDDDILTVFEKNNPNKVIQNGYATKRDRGFLQYITSGSESLEELSIKRIELRLKVVLKFDHNIIDFVGFKTISEESIGILEESLLVLFPHGLQILHLNDFKLQNTELVNILGGTKISVAYNKLFVLSKENESSEVVLNELDLHSRTVIADSLETSEQVITSFEFGGKLAVIFKNSLAYYNYKTKKISYKWNPRTSIKFCYKVKKKVLLIISENNKVYLYSRFGNILYSTDEEEETTNNLDYSGCMYFDMCLIMVAKTGYYQVWKLWESLSTTSYDFRSPKPFTLNNTNNDITLYSTVGDIYSRNDILQTTNLPTKTFNNCMPFIRVTGNLKTLAAYVANKNILLIKHIPTNIWYTILDQYIIDMHWLGNNHLVCNMKRDDDSSYLICYKLPLHDIKPDEFSSYIIWEYELPTTETLSSFHVNSLFKYKQIKRKIKDNKSKADTLSDNLYKTGEVILIFEDHISLIDIISIVHQSGFNIIKKFHLYIQIKTPPELSNLKIEWATNFKDGLFVFSEDNLFKVVKTSASENWQVITLLENIECIVDVIKENIFLIVTNQIKIFNLGDLWDKKNEVLSINIDEDFYPVSVLPEAAILYGIHCIYHNNFTKLNIKHEIYLDELIKAKLLNGIDKKEINSDYRLFNHYKFSLEKILSYKILENEPLNSIIALIREYDEASSNNTIKASNSNMLEIVSNCLRKIEIKHWSYLFKSLDLTPRNLLALCIENNEVKILGVLLLVFLNYNEADLVKDLREDSGTMDDKSKIANTKTVDDSSDISVVNVLKDEELMLEILKLLVTGAANQTDINKASESWDMCFQLIRLLKALDKENKTQLVKKAMTILG